MRRSYLAGSFEHVSFTVWTIVDFYFFSNSFGFSFGMRNADQVAESDPVHAVACTADLFIHFVSTSNASNMVSQVMIYETVYEPGMIE